MPLSLSHGVALPGVAQAALAASEVNPCALGPIVPCSASEDATKCTLERLKDPKITRIGDHMGTPAARSEEPMRLRPAGRSDGAVRRRS